MPLDIHQPSPGARLRGLMRLLRPRQWVKNGFVLAPLLFTGQFADARAVVAAALMAVLFCVASSATYVINDWRDIAASLRRQIGRQAEAINRLNDHLPSPPPNAAPRAERLRERMGHTRLEIAAGLVTGFGVAWLVNRVGG